MKVYIASNIGRIQTKLKIFDSKLKTAPARCYESYANQVVKQAKREVPYKTGRLEKSIHYRTLKSKGKTTISFFAYAVNPDTGEQYAGTQHDVNYRHKNGRKWHYISDPMNQYSTSLMMKLMRYIKYE